MNAEEGNMELAPTRPIQHGTGAARHLPRAIMTVSARWPSIQLDVVCPATPALPPTDLH